MKLLKNRVFWKTVLFTGCLPFIGCLWTGLDRAINGFSFLWSPVEKGLDAFLSAVLLFSYLFWPGYLIGLMLILVSVFALIYLKYK